MLHSSLLLALVCRADGAQVCRISVDGIMKHAGKGELMPELDPDVADEVPWSDKITPYDDRHKVTYMRLLDARQMALTGRKSPGLSFTVTLWPNLSAPAIVGKTI